MLLQENYFGLLKFIMLQNKTTAIHSTYPKETVQWLNHPIAIGIKVCAWLTENRFGPETFGTPPRIALTVIGHATTTVQS